MTVLRSLRFRRLTTQSLRWIAALLLLAGGIAPADDDASIREAAITDTDRLHWAFQPLDRPAFPVIRDATWAANSIDCFVLNRLEAMELAPSLPADRVTLIRRLYFDLVGLPPTLSEVDEFVADTSPDAYERLVERLLASPQFGERWAQHWLDLARFAETDGFEHDKVRTRAWAYRDWVIAALNADMPYDRFVSLQLAADELGEDSIATAFCLSGPDMPDINSQEERRHNVLNELTSTVGSTLLGLQIGCAQCHDHKFDPISQADFYRLRAVFEPSVEVQKNESLSVLEERAGDPPASFVMIRGDFRRPGPGVVADVPRIAAAVGPSYNVVSTGRSQGRRTSLAHWLTHPRNPLTARVIVNRIWQHHFGKGLSSTPSDFGRGGGEPSHPQLLDWLATELIRRDWSLKELHRLIVTSATYRQASRRAASGDADGESDRRWTKARTHDPHNTWLSRFPRRRLSGEAIRDAMLAASGTLNRAAAGPGVRPRLPGELRATLLKDQWNVSPREADHYRRSIYIFARRNLRYPIFDAFDRPDANASCPRRSRSTTAPQSLLLLNSEFSLEAARRLAGAVLAQHPRLTDLAVVAAVRRCFCREPSNSELALMRRFLDDQIQLLRAESGPPDRLALPWPDTGAADAVEAAALTDLCLALFNANEFVYVD